MKITIFVFYVIIFFLISCNKDEVPSQYPRTFKFDHSNITVEKAFVIGDNESFVEIGSQSGTLSVLRSEAAFDLYGYIRKLGAGNYVESIELLSKDTLRLNTWVNGAIQANYLSANLDTLNGEIINKDLYDYTIHWDKNLQELKFCLVLSLGILERNNNFSSEIDYDFCQSNDAIVELKNLLMNSSYLKNDTLGIYLMDMIYK